MSGSQSLSKYEIIRNQIIEERKKEWNSLLEAKKDFDDVTTKKITVRNRYQVPEGGTLRRSSRIKTRINYTEDPTGFGVYFYFEVSPLSHISSEYPFYLNTCQTWTDLVMTPHVRIPRRERVSQTSPS